MFKFSISGGFFISISCIMFVNSSFYKCIHDDISLKVGLEDSFGKKQVRSKRESNGTIFEPLKIHIHKENIDNRLSLDVLYNIDIALLRAVKFISETIKVRHTARPFFIERISCSQRWRFGLNQGKCSRRKSTPEFCSLKGTDFIIPVQYLSKLEVFDSHSSNPVYVIDEGPGVENSNFVLFVISKVTSWCQKNDVQAYGSFCRLDHTNRPVAGLLNFCTENFSKKLHRPSHYFNIVMHELFHILGFSKHLYSKFKTCTSSYDCKTPKYIIDKDKNGVQRLIFPEVVSSMQVHFNCSKDNFGGPLENLSDIDSTNEYSSHWHPLLMYSSIMTPSLKQEDYVVIDNISLALLASTGWYRINFSKAQQFWFGQGEGCDFGFGDSCKKSKFLCNSVNQTGCDVANLTIGKCQKIVPYHPCGVYKPNTEESCVEGEGKLYGLQSTVYERQCVVLPKKDMTSVPTCVAIGLKMSSYLNSFVNGSWIDHELMEKMENGSLSLDCPSNLSFCLVKNLDMSEAFCKSNNDEWAIFVQMFFLRPSQNELFDAKKFEITTLQGVASQIGIPYNYIVNSSLRVSSPLRLDFVICLPLESNTEELGMFIEKVQEFLKNSTYVNIFKEHKNVPVASDDIIVHPENTLTFDDYEGFHALVVFPVVCGIFILASFVASLVRLVLIQRHRPLRESIEIQELSDIHHSS